MKRVALLSVLLSSLSFAMQNSHVENPVLAKQIKKEDSANIENKGAAVSASGSAEVKKGFWARAFACCNGKSEKN